MSQVHIRMLLAQLSLGRAWQDLVERVGRP
jgi:hypothetical protein